VRGACRGKGDHIITVVTEHKAVLDTCRHLEKAGYRVEGTLPRDHWWEGGFTTTYLMAAYRDDPIYRQEEHT